MLYRFSMTLGQRIRMARKRVGLTQGELADRVGDITSQAVSQWERDETGPERDKVPLLCRVLKITEEWLFHGKEPLPPLQLDDFDRFMDELVAIGKAIPEAQRSPAIQILKALVPHPQERRRTAPAGFSALPAKSKK